MSDSGSTRAAPTGSWRRLMSNLLAGLETRFQLFAVEYKIEKYRLVELLLLTTLAIFFGIIAAVLFGVTLVMLVPADYQIHVVAGICLLCGLGALGTGFRLRRRLKTPPPFAESLAQLKKDREWIASKK